MGLPKFVFSVATDVILVLTDAQKGSESEFGTSQVWLPALTLLLPVISASP